jgi:histidine ammonia-lyase
VTVVLSDRSDLTLDAFRRVAWNGEDARLDADALRQIGSAREAFMALIKDGSITVYGVTSGFGDRARLQLTPEERARQAREATDRGVSFGAALPERVTRGIIFARLANIVGGHAAIRPELGRTLTRRGTRRKASARFDVAGAVVAARLPEDFLDGRCQVLERSGSYL